jgi:uncharacterized membrane protein SirB2
MANQIARIVMLVVGILISVEYFLKLPLLNDASTAVLNWVTLMSAFAVVIGGINIIVVHRDNIAKRKGPWMYSIVLLVFFFLTVAMGLTQGTSAVSYRFLYDRILVSCSTTMSAMLAFYIASSSFRAFRARNVEAALLLVSAAIVMLGQVPVGELIWRASPQVADWILQVLNMAAQRGFMIAGGVGAMAVSLRMILGYGKSRLGAE